jgi:outer membrane protein OmpA-like peptidoglycan-associated protein
LSIQAHNPLTLDTDGDGIIDSDDQCPTVPEDLDGVKDSDGCIDLTAVTVNVVDAKGKAIKESSWTVGSDTGGHGETFHWQVMDGNNVDILASAEGYKDLTYTAEVQHVDNTSVTIELVANVGTLLVKALDTKGNTINAGWIVKGTKPFTKKSDIAHTVSTGDMRIQVRAKGFKPVTKKATIITGQETIVEVQMQISLANVDGNKITIDDSVYFVTGSHVILEKSHRLLDDIAHILEEHPSIIKLEIEGHTDSVGNDAKNKSLSQKRAEAVREYLIEKTSFPTAYTQLAMGKRSPSLVTIRMRGVPKIVVYISTLRNKITVKNITMITPMIPSQKQ